MALLDKEKDLNNKSGADKLILGVIIVLVVAVISIVALMMYLLNTQSVETMPSAYVDGVESKELYSSIIAQNGAQYILLKQIAELAGYEAYNGDYIHVSEEINKCHVIIENEEVMQFNANSNEIIKIKVGENLVYAKVTLKNPVLNYENELYISIEDITNALYLYNQVDEKGNLQVYTLETMYQTYNNYAIQLGYAEIINTFINRKAILSDILVCKNSKNKYGVIKSNGDIVIEFKYDDMKFVEETGDFIVTYNEVKGTIHDKQTKIQISYDDIEYISYANVYAVTSNKKIAFFDANGVQLMGFNYDSVGSNTTVKNANSVKFIDTKGLLVVKSNDKYGLINKEGVTVVDFNLDDVYSTIFGGNVIYYVVKEGMALNINSIV